MEAKTLSKTLPWVEYIPQCKERKSETSNGTYTYCVNLKNLEGLKEKATAETYQVQAILFDQKYGRFIGSFWIGKSVQVKSCLAIFNQSFYFYTSVPLKELLLVFEIITPSKIKNSSKTCGWLGLPLVEVEDEITYKMPLIDGTPLFLLVIGEDGKKSDIKLTEHTTGMELSLSLSSLPVLLDIMHLLPENVLIDTSTEIPGVLPENEDIYDDDYVFKPRLKNCITVVLERLSIRMHSPLNSVEKEILQKVQAHLTAAKPDENLLKSHLVQRRLQIAVYNGYCFIQEPDFYNLLVETLPTPTVSKTLRRASSLGSLNFGGEEGLVLRSDVKLPNIPDDPNISIIFLLEYVIGLENSDEMQISVNSVSKNPICNIAISWGFCGLDSLRKNPSQNIILSSDPTSSPHKVKFLKLEKSLELTFSTFSLLKQKSGHSPFHLNENQMLSYPSDSTSSKSEVSAVLSQSHFRKHVAKHKSVADIPMSIEQSEKKSTEHLSGVQKNEANLALQEVMLVSSSLPLIPPLLHSFPIGHGASSGTFTKIYWDKLQPILDHHGKPAFIIENTVPYTVDSDIEFQSLLEKSECLLKFLAISSFDELVEIPCEVFFTFQFYRFLPIKTESLILRQLSEDEDQSSKLSFVFTLHKVQEIDSSPGFNVTYNIDPTELHPGEYKSFMKYLIENNLHIDLWNAKSMLYFGTALLPLKYFCRQGKDAVASIVELDIVNCEFSDESLSQHCSSSRKPLGKLHVNLASIRHPLSPKVLQKFEEGRFKAESDVIYSNGINPSDPPKHVISKARPIAETDKELSKLLLSRYSNSQNMVPNPSETEERRRKLARMEAVRNLENNLNNESGNEMQRFFKEKQRDLISIESYIMKNKTDIIHSILEKNISSEKLLFPTIGCKVYFEFVLHNPFPIPKNILVMWKSPELSLVVDNEGHSLRNKHKLNFIETNQDKPCILMQPGEKAHIPFTYQCFSAPSCSMDLFKVVSGHHFTSEMLSSIPAFNFVQTMDKVSFMTDDGTLLALLNLKIQPLPPLLTHVFKFLSMEHSMFKKSIQISNESNMNNVDLHCPDPAVVYSLLKNENSDGSLKILVKAPTKSAGKCTEFYIFVYKDKFQVTPFQTWNISICPLQRIDLSCVAGQLMRSSLLIRGAHSTNLVRCFSSSQDLLLDPSEAFVLAPFSVQELSMNIRSLLPGMKHFQITMVDQSQEVVLQTWLLVLSCQKPSISKAFQIHLTVGKEAAKRITYTNPYHQSRNFILYSSHPHLLSLRESQFTAPAGSNYSIGLYFLPQNFIFSETIFLYMNDASDKNEETYCIKVICQ